MRIYTHWDLELTCFSANNHPITHLHVLLAIKNYSQLHVKTSCHASLPGSGNGEEGTNGFFDFDFLADGADIANHQGDLV